MRLSIRLLLLILVCLLPVMGAQVYSQVSLYRQRQLQLGDLALRQAELANGDLTSMVEGVRQLALAIAQFPEIHAAGTACGERLAALQHGLPAYRFLAAYDPAGQPLCTSSPAVTAAAAPLGSPVPGTAVSIGRYATDPAIEGAFLPITVRPPQQDAAAPPVVVAGLDLQWLARHLDELRLDQAPPLANSVLFLADSDGTVLARFPAAPQWVGHRLPPDLLPLATGATATIARLPTADGGKTLVAVVPAGVPPVGLATIESLSLPDLTSDLSQATLRDALLLAVSALLALTLAWVIAKRFIYRPTQGLLSAAQRWRDGDLTARAQAGPPHSEFGALAQSFNAMASTLQARDLERRLHVELLASEVAKRTSDLSDTNNRLQVEIAEREKTEAVLHQAQKLQAVGQLAGGIAHDFNNMLATILGSLELMERRVAQSEKSGTPADADRLRTLIERATGAVQRGAKLTSRLLAFSRRQRLSARPTDLNHLVSELVMLAASTLGSRVRVTTDLAADLWPAMVDPSQMEAAILNLCLNARDAMPEGGQLAITTANEALEASDTPDGPLPGDFVRISVVDTGMGMTPDVLRRAFDPFFTTKGPGGSGLGLSQVYGTVRQSGGTVRVESTPGQGTRVVLLLPRATSPAEIAPAPRSPADARRGLPVSRVLVVDDDHAVRAVTVEMLKDLGCDTIQAADGVAALALLEQPNGMPDLILLDYAMPGMNGLQLARTLRERGITVPVALVTGYAELADSDGAASPLDALLRKPFTIRELDATLVRLRRRARADAKAMRAL
ncbi:MAG: ATP-binding protein [Acetobacteraceae bacterium]|jgi:signal transduction histidine kinase/ActR/RegA family two-component response regulator